jgi:hypothetical protein
MRRRPSFPRDMLRARAEQNAATLRSVTYDGLLALIAFYAPADAAANFTSKDLQAILTGSAPHAGRARQFLLRAEPHNMPHFSVRKPDIAITYPWGMDLRRDLRRFLERLYWRLRRSGRVASREEYAGKTFWFDILFNDQNSKDIVLDLNASQKIFEEAWVHAVLLVRDPLSRGWVLFELGVRVWAVAKEFGLDHATLLLLFATHGAEESYTSRSDWTAYPAALVAGRLPLLVADEDVTDMQAEVFRYAGGDAFGSMTTSQAADKPEIQKRLALLFESADNFNAVVSAVAEREKHCFQGAREGGG